MTDSDWKTLEIGRNSQQSCGYVTMEDYVVRTEGCPTDSASVFSGASCDQSKCVMCIARVFHIIRVFHMINVIAYMINLSLVKFSS
jgi:hypothetical protein